MREKGDRHGDSEYQLNFFSDGFFWGFFGGGWRGRGGGGWRHVRGEGGGVERLRGLERNGGFTLSGMYFVGKSCCDTGG